MIQISPYHPEIDAIWHALSSTGARSIAVVSAEPGEGTTLIAAALARRAGMSAAQDTLRPHGRYNQPDTSALLVDLDLVRPSVARVLGLRPAAGQIVRLDALGIAVLGNPGGDSIAAWRERAQLRDQINEWRTQWSVIVLDAAPLLTAETDEIPGTAAAAAAAADVCVLVTLAGRTAANRVKEAREKLAGAGANLVGSILNDRDNPSLLAEMNRETYRLAKFFPRAMAALRGKMSRSSILSARV